MFQYKLNRQSSLNNLLSTAFKPIAEITPINQLSHPITSQSKEPIQKVAQMKQANKGLQIYSGNFVSSQSPTFSNIIPSQNVQQ